MLFTNILANLTNNIYNKIFKPLNYFFTEHFVQCILLRKQV